MSVAAHQTPILTIPSCSGRPAIRGVLLRSYYHDRRIGNSTREDPASPEANDDLAEGAQRLPALHDATVEAARIGIRRGAPRPTGCRSPASRPRLRRL
jgi:hypothetical protein